MSDPADAWDAFWDLAAHIAVRQARRAQTTAHLSEAVCVEVDQLLRSCDRAMRDLRAAMRALPDLLGPEVAACELQKMEAAVKQATVANRSMKATWRAERPVMRDE